MNIFDLQFGSRQRRGIVWDSLCKEDNSPERGNLFIVQELRTGDKVFLQNLTKVIKNSYYSPGANNPEDALREALKSANEFLTTHGAKIKWLGNLHSAIMVVRGNDVFFSRTGQAKVILLSDGNIVNLGDKTEVSSAGQAFSNIACGQLPADTRFGLITPLLDEKLNEVGMLRDLSQEETDLNQIDDVIKKHKKEIGTTPGILLLGIIDKGMKTKISLPRVPREIILVVILAVFFLIGGLFFRQENKNDSYNQMLEELLATNNKQSLINELEKGSLPPHWQQQFSDRILLLTNWNEVDLIETTSAPGATVLTSDATNLYLAGKSLVKINLAEEVREESTLPEVVVAGSGPTFFGGATIYFDQGQQLSINDYSLTYIAQYGSSFYFWKGNEIVRYHQGKLESWFKPEVRRPVSSSPTAIDGWVWIARPEAILGYYKGGEEEKNFPLTIYPTKTNFTKIISSDVFYLLDTAEGRVIIVSKEGELANQYHNPSIKQADDMTLFNGDIYLLIEEKVYQLKKKQG